MLKYIHKEGKIMKKFKITDGFIRKVEKRLLTVAKKEYQPDGIFVCLDGINITCWEDKDFSLEFKIRYGRMADGTCVFQHKMTIWMGDGNLDFLAGQFYERINLADGNE